jgi:prophage regulatory protein
MRLLSLDELRTEKGIPFSRQHIHRLVRAGKFPRPVKVGLNRNGWIEAEIDGHLKMLVEARDEHARAA